MEEIINPIPRELLKQELTEDKRLRNTNRGGNILYICTAFDSPNVMQEIGRLREIAFRREGGGTGFSVDIDRFDTMNPPCKQLIVWNPEAEEIIGGYRFIYGPDIRFDEQGQPIIATSHLFQFSDKFIQDYLPQTVELGRSFVAVEYQASRADAKGLFALDNLFDGLAALMVVLPDAHYFFGKMTMYPSYKRYARDLILHFLDKHFGDREQLVYPHNPLLLDHPTEELDVVTYEDDFKADYKLLNAAVRRLGCNIPPLVNAYMNLSPTMRIFGTAINDEFGDVEETGLMININEMHEDKRVRHIASFIKEKPEWAHRVAENKVLYPLKKLIRKRRARKEQSQASSDTATQEGVRAKIRHHISRKAKDSSES